MSNIIRFESLRNRKKISVQGTLVDTAVSQGWKVSSDAPNTVTVAISSHVPALDVLINQIKTTGGLQ